MEHNVTGQDYGERGHLSYAGEIVDIHTHVMVTRPGDPKSGPPLGKGPGASTDQAEMMLDAAREFGITQTWTMCLPDDIPLLRERFGILHVTLQPEQVERLPDALRACSLDSPEGRTACQVPAVGEPSESVARVGPHHH